jgi:hypothetical protein
MKFSFKKITRYNKVFQKNTVSILPLFKNKKDEKEKRERYRK